nr:integrase, catalytic region, zinc finger, CCHC-type, peptidase aspartic, catalytic [Tanacetum cinerariifolium]
MAKASPTQAWLWHQRLSHFNFDYINLLTKKDVVIGLPKLKFVKDQLCSSYEVSKAKRSSFKSKAVPSLKGRLNLLHMDLCGPMRVASINRKKYIMVIVDDYSRYTWTLFLHAHVPSQQELDLLFGPLYDEFFTAESAIASLMFFGSAILMGSSFGLTAFSDANHARCIDTRKSTSEGIQFLGDKLVCWMSKKQDCTAMSSAEAEYMALSTSCAQVMWIRTQL